MRRVSAGFFFWMGGEAGGWDAGGEPGFAGDGEEKGGVCANESGSTNGSTVHRAAAGWTRRQDGFSESCISHLQHLQVTPKRGRGNSRDTHPRILPTLYVLLTVLSLRRQQRFACPWADERSLHILVMEMCQPGVTSVSLGSALGVTRGSGNPEIWGSVGPTQEAGCRKTGPVDARATWARSTDRKC